ncbi:Uncharacterised protein [Mycobacteroides abscessus subsp. bolletii]|uniref:hypothetical protein n=1 Tax=Mycobacteroides abscessus TaxID=36809 RepID=UPI0009A88BA8|nr:hypothetical protein [Mycobacteroides abscessus]SKX65863.1 Uncharacterised protein [Mycobacteroides abscessus subsp. bolletii]
MTAETAETTPDGPVLEHRAGAVSGSESVETADSGSTVPREGGWPEVEREEFPHVSESCVQTVREWGAPESHGAIRCAPWCTDGAGHADSVMRSDQACWSPSNAVVLGLAEGAPALPVDLESWAQLDPPHVAVAAYRAWHGLPVVDVHLYHPHENPNVSVDFNVKLTPSEAVQLARFLLDAAALAGAGVQR